MKRTAAAALRRNNVPLAAHAQWLSHPASGIPRTEDGTPSLSAPTSHTADGKPDPRAYTTPFSIRYTQTLTPDTDLLEYVCAENEKDRVHLVGQ